MAGPETMAKKRAPKKAVDQRTFLAAMRCREAFKLWLERFAKSERTTPAQLMEHGLVNLAKLKGFEEPPER